MTTFYILTLTSFYLMHASSTSTSTVETEGASQVASQQTSSSSQRNPVVDNQNEVVKKIKVPLCIWSEEIRILNNMFGKPKGRFIEVYCDGQHYYCNGTKFIYKDPKPEAECNPQTDSEVKAEHSVKVFGTKESEQVLRRVRYLLDPSRKIPVKNFVFVFQRDLLGLQIPYFAFKYDIDGNFLGIDSNSQRFEDIMRDKVTRENQVQIETLDPKNPIIYISSYKYNPTIVDDIKEGQSELKCIPIPDYLAQEPSFICTSGSSKNIGIIIQEKEKLFASRNRTCIPLLVNKKMGNNIMRFCNAYYVYLLYRNNGIASKKILYVCSEVITFELLLTRFQFRNHKKSMNPDACIEKHIIYQKLKKIYNQHQQVFWTENGYNIIIKMGFDKEYDDQELILVPYVYIEYVNPEEYELFACFFTKQLIFAGYVSLEVRLG